MNVDGAPHRALRWLGHATVLIERDGARFLTDPLLRGRFLHVRRRAAPIEVDDLPPIDAVLISHLHADHFDVPSLRRLPEDVAVIVPTGAGAFARRAGLRHVEEAPTGRELTIAGVSVTSVAAHHSGFRPPAGPTAEACGYLVGSAGSVYFAGDTGLFAGMAELRGQVDTALLPVGGWGPTLRGHHLDPRQAAQALTLIAPRAARPIHWGTYWPAGYPRTARFHTPGRAFAAWAARLAPAVEVHDWAVGETERARPAHPTAPGESAPGRRVGTVPGAPEA
ncbi:MAG: MBL fold metallo-hydrolase [Dehalococcoidia bacterium]